MKGKFFVVFLSSAKCCCLIFLYDVESNILSMCKISFYFSFRLFKISEK